MLNKLKLACVTGLLPLICGCQSSSTQEPLPARVVTVRCKKPSAPEVWYLAPFAPNLTEHAQRIVAITDDGDRGLIALHACQAYVLEITTH